MCDEYCGKHMKGRYLDKYGERHANPQMRRIFNINLTYSLVLGGFVF